MVKQKMIYYTIEGARQIATKPDAIIEAQIQ